MPSTEEPVNNHWEDVTFPYVFPGEIRNRIYQNVLSSPSGSITLARAQHRIRPARYRIYPCDIDGADEIRLSFLRTCKIIYEECKDLLWTLNTLDLESLRCSGPGQLSSISMYIPENLLSKLRSVALDIDFTIEGCQVDALQYILDELDIVTAVGPNELQSVTIHLRNKFGTEPMTLPHRSLQELLWMDDHQEPDNEGVTMLDALLGTLRTPFKALAIERHMCIDLGSPSWDKKYGYPKRKVRANTIDPNRVLQNINEAWGGDLKIDNVTCYKDGQCVEEMWSRFPPGEDHALWFALKQDIDLWVAAKDYNTRRNISVEGAVYQTLRSMGDSKAFQDEVIQDHMN